MLLVENGCERLVRLVRFSEVENSWERLVGTGRMLGELNESRISRLDNVMRG